MKLGFIIFVICCIGCHSTRRQWYLDTRTDISSTLQPIVDSLVKYNRVDNSSIGFVGDKSIIYKTFESLCATASDAELIRLTAHNIPAMRVYAFWALSKRNSKELFNIVYRHRKDRASFAYMSGCDGGGARVNKFLLFLVTPGYIDNQTSKLGWTEIDKLKKEIR